MKVDQRLDTRGLSCPLPILKAKKALVAMRQGDVLEVLATDPGSEADFEAFCRITGHALLAKSQDETGAFSFLIRRSM